MWTEKPIKHLRILYDGQCSFCASYIRLWHIRNGVADKVELADARTRPDLVAEFRNQGLEINDGMIAELDGAVYYGHEEMTVLSALSSSSSLFNRINGYLFRRSKVSRSLYPFLVTGRRSVLFLLGRRAI
jgi:predicted DCC family thiol-disulfide oxidoreductase YuxK